MSRRFSFARVRAVIGKEFIQMRRDRLTLGMIVAVPLMQLFMFGFAINVNPKHLPAAVSISDPGVFSDSIVAALANSSYFEIEKATNSPVEARRMLDQGEVSFVVEIPANFSHDLVRGAHPRILVEADATDPSASTGATASLSQLFASALRDDLKGPLAMRAATAPAFDVVVHPRYNPDVITQYNVVPGLLAVILTMSMVLTTCLALARERERGTYENLLAMPLTPLELMLGKIAPNIAIGAVQSVLVLLIAHFVFNVPMIGSFALLAAMLFLFIVVNLAVGYTFSTIAQNQVQAMQLTMFFFLPVILLSGFAFPFRGMPVWAQWIGEVLPATHFLRVVRGILLKGNGFAEIWPDTWPLILFLFVAGSLALLRFRRTLD